MILKAIFPRASETREGGWSDRDISARGRNISAIFNYTAIKGIFLGDRDENGRSVFFPPLFSSSFHSRGGVRTVSPKRVALPVIEPAIVSLNPRVPKLDLIR